jgi:hypothetical protein
VVVVVVVVKLLELVVELLELVVGELPPHAASAIAATTAAMNPIILSRIGASVA